MNESCSVFQRWVIVSWSVLAAVAGHALGAKASWASCVPEEWYLTRVSVTSEGAPSDHEQDWPEAATLMVLRDTGVWISSDQSKPWQPTIHDVVGSKP
jgi:hypothetical protein